MRRAGPGALRVEAAKSVDQLTMRARIDQRAIIMLSVNFDEFARDRAQRLRGRRAGR